MPEITYREAIHDAMVEEMRRDENVFLIGEDIGTYGGAFGVSAGMLAEFGPERVRETPISELAIVGAAAGAAPPCPAPRRDALADRSVHGKRDGGGTGVVDTS